MGCSNGCSDYSNHKSHQHYYEDDNNCVTGVIQRVGRDFVDLCCGRRVETVLIADIKKVKWLSCRSCLLQGDVGEDESSHTRGRNRHRSYYEAARDSKRTSSSHHHMTSSSRHESPDCEENGRVQGLEDLLRQNIGCRVTICLCC